MAEATVARKSNPFYIQTTGVKEKYIDDEGAQKEVELHLVTLPPGTVLFRGVRIPNPEEGEDVRYFYRDYLGDPEGKNKVCLKPTHNVFFYPFPLVPFGIHTVGKTFHSMQAVVLVQPMTVISSISPSPMVRGEANRYKGDTAPYARCTNYNYECHPQTYKEKEAASYDNCIHPEYAQRSGVRGWMAIADLDSIKSKKEAAAAKAKSKEYTAAKSSMGKYVIELEKRQPGLGSMLLTWMYADNNNHAGFPELALYPYAKHQGPTTLSRVCKSSNQAVILLEHEAAANNLNYLPLAAFTKDMTVDMVNGHFSYECLGVAKNTFAVPADSYHGQIETRVLEWMDNAQTKGLQLPHYGAGNLSFDMRTGFYVLPQVIPRRLRVPLPADAAEDGKTEIPYSFLIQPLATAEDKRRALTYMLLFRSFIPGQAMRKFGLEKAFGVRRAMIFSRPPVLKWIYGELGIPMPKEVTSVLGRAAAQYKENIGAKSKKELDAEAAAAAVTLAVAKEAPAEEEEKADKPDFFTLHDAAGNPAGISGSDFFSKGFSSEIFITFEEKAAAAGLQSLLDEDDKISTYFTPESTPEKIASKKEYFFGKELAPKMMVDDVAMFSITERGESIKQAQLLFKELADLLGKDAARAATVTDATACVGGNTLTLADIFANVESVEISPQRSFMLAHNVVAAGKSANVKVHCADYTKIMYSLKQSAIFFDPPWGGVDYKSVEELNMSLGPYDLGDIIARLVGPERLALIVGVKAPVNYNMKGLQEKLQPTGARIHRVYKMKKMNFIIVKSAFLPGQNSPVYIIPNIIPRTPSPLAIGGAKTRKSKNNGNKTRKQKLKKEESIEFAKQFSRVWEAHAKIFKTK